MSRVIFALVMLFIVTRVVTMFSKSPDDLGVSKGKLAECRTSPNCISSQVKRNHSNYVTPLRLSRNIDGPMAKLAALLDEMPRTKLVSLNDDYVHFEFRSLLFGFVDDVEFLRDVPHGVIHVRSASRFGYSDFGTNRRRTEKIRKRWDELTRQLRKKIAGPR